MLERGEVANSWRRERWDSLRLLTPNWQSRLPGLPYDGRDPDGYMSAAQVAELIGRFATSSQAPVRTGVNVTSLRQGVGRDATEITTATDQGEIRSQAVVIATGACNRPSVPQLASAIPTEIEQFTPFSYRNPDDLPDGGVLVVGASATGVQLAREIQGTGRQVIVCVGEHVRLPRTYRGADVLWWMEASGVWDQRYDEVDDLARARSLPSPQLVGTPERITLDLNALIELGVELVGRAAAVRDHHLLFSGGLRNVLALADLKLERLLDGFDEWATGEGHEAQVGPVERFSATTLRSPSRLNLDLRGGEISSILWATGFRPDYRWLELPVLDGKGRLRHDGGVVDRPGVYALGLPVLRRRKSTFIHGIEDDAREVVAHLAGYLSGRR